MPSSLHQTVIDLLRRAPDLVPQLLGLTGAAAPTGGATRLIDATLDQISRRVDLAFEVLGADGEPLAVGVEIQLGIKPAKRITWPVYVTTMRTPERPSACLLIIAPNRRVARWAARPISLGPGNESFRVHVIGPDEIPRISDAKDAQDHPELGFLSALAHADRDRDPTLVRVALAGLDALDSERARSYGLVLLDTIDQALRRAVEGKFMEDLNKREEEDHDDDYEDEDEDEDDAGRDRGPPVTLEFVDRALLWGRQLLIQEERKLARSEGRQEGLQEGRQEGEQEGILLSRRQVLTRLLTRVGLQPTADEADRIAVCGDITTLDRWIDQAIGAVSVAEALR